MAVTVERTDGIATVRMEHGPVNALDLELCEELAATFDGLGTDRDVAAIVLTGSGRAFSAGVDLARILAGDASDTERFLAALSRCFLAVYRAPVPTVAAVNGHAIAGGCVLACACDRALVSADERVLVGLTELAVGVPFPTAAIEVVRARTATRCAEAVYLARNHPPAEALAIGFVDEVVPPARLTERARQQAAALARIPPVTFRLAKEQVQRPVNDAIEALAAHWEPRVVAAWTDEDVRAVMGRFMAQLSQR